MTEAQPFSDQPEAASLIDPASLHILIVDASHSSRQHISSLLRDCSYQVTACKTSHEAIQILKAQQGPDGNAGFDLILKEHSPSAGTNACRLLRSAQREPVLKGIPIIVASTQEDRDVMVSCLQLGAADYMLKPLRHNELRNLWARVYWWRRAFYLQQQPSSDLPAREEPFLYSSSGASDETKWCVSEILDDALSDDEVQQNELAVGDAERSGEGSAPNGSNGNDDSRENGSRANGSKNGSKTGVDCSRTQAKDFNGNRNSGAMGEGNGHSATKAEQGSNNPSRGAAPGTVNCYSGVGPMARQESAALTGTAEGVYAALSTQMQAIEALADAQATAAAGVVPPDTTRQAGNGLEAKAAADVPEPNPLGATIQQPRSQVSPPGFRAYVSKENLRKRSGELVQKVEDDSSGSGRTTSLDGAKRRPVSKLGKSSGPQAPVSEAAASDATVLLNRPVSGPVPPLFAGSSMGANASGNGNVNDSAWSGGMQKAYYSNYPYGMVPTFGVLPQFWGQMPSSGGGDAPDMSAYFNYASAQQGMQQAQQQQNMQQQQQQGMQQSMQQPSMSDMQQGMQQQQLGMQQQQLAMHNQLMYQHSFMMQQYGMPGGGYPSFPPMLQNSQQGGKPVEQKQKSGVPPTAPTAIRPMANAPGPMSQQAAVSGLQRLASNAQQMLPSCDPTSGLAVGTGTGTNAATGTTLGTAVKGGNTGATSQNTAPVLNAEGCLVEPSRKERRAQALHKYKQKRKNLCFTKKIRYESRKQLAQARPRVKGQFVRVRADDVGAVAEAMAIAQEAHLDSAVWHGTMSGDAVVPQLALLKAHGNQEVAAELMAAAEQLANPTVENTEEDDFDEEDYGEEDDVNSPAENSVAPGASKAAPNQAGEMVHAPSKALEDAGNVTGRHSSDSGSNSPDIKARAGRS